MPRLNVNMKAQTFFRWLSKSFGKRISGWIFDILLVNNFSASKAWQSHKPNLTFWNLYQKKFVASKMEDIIFSSFFWKSYKRNKELFERNLLYFLVQTQQYKSSLCSAPTDFFGTIQSSQSKSMNFLLYFFFFNLFQLLGRKSPNSSWKCKAFQSKTCYENFSLFYWKSLILI